MRSALCGIGSALWVGVRVRFGLHGPGFGFGFGSNSVSPGQVRVRFGFASPVRFGSESDRFGIGSDSALKTGAMPMRDADAMAVEIQLFSNMRYNERPQLQPGLR